MRITFPFFTRIFARQPAILLAALMVAASAAVLADDEEEQELDRITVYGSRIAQTLDAVTSNVTIVTAEEIERRNLTSLRDVFRTQINLIDSDFVDAGFVIRGISSEGLTPGGAALASVYIDGIQQSGNAVRRGARGLFDIEQVEIYRGPQSTLSGRAALAGALYIRTRDPSHDPDFRAAAYAGENSLVGTALAFGGSLGDTRQAAFRVSAEFEQSRNDLNYPTYEDFSNFSEFERDRYYQIRTKLLLEPDALPNTNALMTYSYSYDSPYIRDIGGPVLGFDFSENRGDFNLPVFTENREAVNHNGGLEISHSLNDGMTLTALTTVNRNDTERPSVNLNTPGETNVLEGGFDQRLLSQELRLNMERGLWRSVGGIYLAREENEADFLRPDFFGRRDFSKVESRLDNMAVFGEVNYRFADGWTVVAGGRFDRTEQDTSTFFSRNDNVLTDQEVSSSESIFLPKFGLVHDFDNGLQALLTAQKGFRSGGAGVRRDTGEQFEFDPEVAWNYELVLRGVLADGRGRWTASAFYQDWSDQQVELQLVPGQFETTQTVNAASSSSHGVELDVNMGLGGGWSMFAGVAYLETSFDDFPTLNLGPLDGLPFPEAPEWNLVVGLDYENDRGLFFGVDAEYVGEALARLGQPPQEFLETRVVTNAQLGWRQGRYTFMVFGENLLDERYFTFTDNDIAATVGAPRRLGVRVDVVF